jgi:hypothetical protein
LRLACQPLLPPDGAAGQPSGGEKDDVADDIDDITDHDLFHKTVVEQI